ncbi:MAG: hypothetical protein KAI47_19345 [Deltaproteobacteria bacterium]|nr:hypothetical protein [Deltaproteobacteria bacterium]
MLRPGFHRLSIFSIMTSFALMSSCAFVGGGSGGPGQARTAHDAKARAKGKGVPKDAKKALATSNPSALASPPTEDEAKRRQRNQHIVGEVRAILKAKHSALPELEAQTTDSKEEPTVRVINETPYPLTVWFAGPCSQKLETPARGHTEIRLCTGTYNLAGKVESPDFFPLVRENQVFDRGMDYVLQIIIRAEPSTINKH